MLVSFPQPVPEPSGASVALHHDLKMERRYISNNLTPQMLQFQPEEYLNASLEAILKETPPRASYQESHLGGLYTGYTGLAYLLLCISSLHPDLQVMGHNCHFWAERYLKGSREDLRVRRGNCGISCEKLAFEAVRACVTKEPEDVIEFVSNAPSLIGPYTNDEEDPFPSDVVTGRAGALYLMRMVRHWVPSMGSCLDSPINRLAEKMLEKNGDGDFDWSWHGKHYLGAAHGEIGIITQLVLTKPSLAGQFANRMEKLLDLQTEGNWPSSEMDGETAGRRNLVQWCHGATGFIYSLQALRPHFPATRPSHPDMRARIDAAIADAKNLVWEKGLLTKEPSLCHGILGNALVLPRGPKRDHFLSLATPGSIRRVRDQDPTMFEPATYGKAPGVMMHYHSSATWAWAVYDQENPGMVMYSDI